MVTHRALGRWSGQLWTLTLLAALAFLAVDTAERIVRLRALAAVSLSDLPAPVPDPGAPSGFACDQHVLPLGYPDSYQWIRQTQDMLAEKTWRVRRADYDNHPDGREVHWSASVHGWLAWLAWGDHWLTGESIGRAVERMAPFSMPLSLALLCLVGTPWVARRFGGLAAALFAPVLVSCLPFYELFAAEAPDHHGWVSVCGLATVLFLAAGGAGWVRTAADRRQARGYFALSGVAGGAGLWISAATQVPVLIGIGAGVVLGIGRAAQRESRGTTEVEPGLWRWWGIAGAVTSLGFYLLEYFPAHFGLRLEVNHPLYALAWLGAGDFLARVVQCRRAGFWWAEMPRLALGLGALLVLPVCICLSPAKVFWVSDPLVWAVHADYIAEFGSLLALAGQLHGIKLLAVVSVLPLVLVPAGLLLASRQVPDALKGALWVTVVPCAVMVGLAVVQSRWYGPACALALAVLIATYRTITDPDSGWRWTRPRFALAAIFGAVLLLPSPLMALWNCLPTFRSQPEFAVQDLRELAVRDAAYWLRQRLGPAPAVVASDPTSTTALIYFGGFDGIGTLYWENKPGLHAGIDFYGAGSSEQAHAVARRLGITHLVIFPWRTFADESARLIQGRRLPEAPQGYAFLRALLAGPGIPSWLRPLPYPTPDYGTGASLGPIRIYEVVPDQPPAEQFLRIARCEFALGRRVEAEGNLARALASDPEYLPARIFSARLAQTRGTMVESAAELAVIRRRVGPDLAGLALEDRVELLTLLTPADDEATAKTWLAACLAEASEPALRQLQPEALFTLAEAVRREEGSDARAGEMVRRIEALVPSRMRERLLFVHAVRLQRENRLREAAEYYRRQLALNADAISACSNLAWILASTSDPALHDARLALAYAQRAVSNSGGKDAFALNALACACAASGDYPAAVGHAREALRLAQAAGRAELVRNLQTCLIYYENGRPYQEAAK